MSARASTRHSAPRTESTPAVSSAHAGRACASRPRISMRTSCSPICRSRCASPASIAIPDGCRRPDATSGFTSTEPHAVAAVMNPFSELPPTPASHFRLYYYGAVLRVVTLAVEALGGTEQAIERFPFLRGYMNELAAYGLEGMSLDSGPAWWSDALVGWEEAAGCRLPLSALREVLGLDHEAVLSLIGAGLAEEDGRYADVFQLLNGTSAQSRPTAAVLSALCGLRDRADARPVIRQLIECGLLHVGNP